MSPMKQLPLGARFSSSALRCSAILLLAPVLGAAQGKSILLSSGTNPAKPQQVTPRSTDSSECSLPSGRLLTRASSTSIETLRASAASNEPVPIKPTTVANTTTVDKSAISVAQPPNNFWNRLKDRARYWVLLAQLNPIPVAIGGGLLLFLFSLFLLQRKRSRVTRR